MDYWEGQEGNSGGSDVVTVVLRRDEGGVRVQGKSNVKTETEIRIIHFEDGGRCHKPRNTGDHWELKKTRKPILFSELQKELPIPCP